MGKKSKNKGTTFNYSINVKNDKVAFKNTKFDFETIRSIAKANPIVSICVNAIKHSVVRVDGYFRIKEEYTDQNLNLKKELLYLEKLAESPNLQQTSRDFWLQVLEDVLVIDRGAVEIIYDNRGYITELYPVDGATIYPVINEYGMLSDPAFYQIIEKFEKPVASFSEKEIILLVNNPSSEINSYGYGASPIERVISAVIANIAADNYNMGLLSKNQIPPFIATLPGASQEQLDILNQKFKLEGQNFNGVFTNAESLSVELLKMTNAEMQYYELILWFARLITASYGLTPQDIGLTFDINRATAQVQHQITKSRAFESILDLRKQFWTKILNFLSEANPNFAYIEFVNEDLDKLDVKVQADIDAIYADILVKLTSLGIEIPNTLADRMYFGHINASKNVEKSIKKSIKKETDTEQYNISIAGKLYELEDKFYSVVEKKLMQADSYIAKVLESYYKLVIKSVKGDLKSLIPIELFEFDFSELLPILNITIDYVKQELSKKVDMPSLEAKLNISFDMPPKFANLLFERQKEVAALVHDTTIGILEKVVREGVETGKSFVDIKNEVAQATRMEGYKAERIARTEVNWAFNEGHRRYVENLGIKAYKISVAKTACDRCLDASKKIYKISKTGVLPVHPNCRCVLVSVIPDEWLT